MWIVNLEPKNFGCETWKIGKQKNFGCESVSTELKTKGSFWIQCRNRRELELLGHIYSHNKQAGRQERWFLALKCPPMSGSAIVTADRNIPIISDLWALLLMTSKHKSPLLRQTNSFEIMCRVWGLGFRFWKWVWQLACKESIYQHLEKIISIEEKEQFVWRHGRRMPKWQEGGRERHVPAEHHQRLDLLLPLECRAHGWGQCSYRRIHWTNCQPPYSWQMGKKF